MSPGYCDPLLLWPCTRGLWRVGGLVWAEGSVFLPSGFVIFLSLVFRTGFDLLLRSFIFPSFEWTRSPFWSESNSFLGLSLDPRGEGVLSYPPRRELPSLPTRTSWSDSSVCSPETSGTNLFDCYLVLKLNSCITFSYYRSYSPIISSFSKLESNSFSNLWFSWNYSMSLLRNYSCTIEAVLFLWEGGNTSVLPF